MLGCRRFLALLSAFPLVFSLACDAVTAGPNTSAPRTQNLEIYDRTCDERMDAIRDWEREQERKLEDEWIDERRGIWQSAAKLQQIKEEAHSMRRELRDNCEANKPTQGNGRSIPDGEDTRDCIGEDGMDDMRAEYRANKNRANQKYAGQRVCLRGTVRSFTESTVNATIGNELGLNVARFSIGHQKDSGDTGWEEWMLSKSVGDTIEAVCTVFRLRGPGYTPRFEDCQHTED